MSAGADFSAPQTFFDDFRALCTKVDELSSQVREQAADNALELRKLELRFSEAGGSEREDALYKRATTGMQAPFGRNRSTSSGGGSYIDAVTNPRMSQAGRMSQSARCSYHQALLEEEEEEEEEDGEEAAAAADADDAGERPASLPASTPTAAVRAATTADTPQALPAVSTAAATSTPTCPAPQPPAARRSGSLPCGNLHAALPTAGRTRTPTNQLLHEATGRQREARRGSLITLSRNSPASRELVRERGESSNSPTAEVDGVGGSPPGSFNKSGGEAGRQLAPGAVTLSPTGSGAGLAAEGSVELSREDRLRMMITQDQNVENLLMQIRRAELDTLQQGEREKNWEQDNPTSSRLVLEPGSRIKGRWDVAMLCLVIASAIMMPLDLAFDIGRDTFPLTIMIILDVSFVVDFLVSFRIAYAEEHLVIRQPKYILRHWFHGWFAFDLIAAFPLEIMNVILSLPVVWWTDAFKLLRIIRLLKVPRVLRSNDKFRRFRVHMSTSSLHLASGLASLLYTSHLLGCIYVAIVRYEVNDQLTSLDQADPTSVVGLAYAGEVEGFVSNSWLPPGDFLPLSPGTPKLALGEQAYLYSLWWAMCAMSGTAVASPGTVIETVFTTLVVLLGFVVTASVIGSFTTAISQLSAASNQERQKRDVIDQLLEQKRIPKPLRRQVQQFYEFAGFEESEQMLAELPISLRLQLDLVLHRNLFLKVPFFKNCDTSFLIVMVPRIHREYTWWGKTIVHENMHGPGLYMVAKGFCKLTSAGTMANLLAHSDFFGEESLLSDAPAPFTVTSITQCQFMVLDRQEFEEVLELYPQMKRMLARYALRKQRSRRTASAGAAEKHEQIKKVRLEVQRTKHLMPLEARQRLNREINEFADLIKDIEAGVRASGKRECKRRSSILASALRPAMQPPAAGEGGEPARATSSTGKRVGLPPLLRKTKTIQVEATDTPEGLRRAVSSFSGDGEPLQLNSGKI